MGAVNCLSIEAIMTRHKAIPSFVFLSLDGDGRDQEKLEQILTKADINGVFLLEVGTAGCRTFLEQRASLLQPGAHSARLVGRCAACP